MSIFQNPLYAPLEQVFMQLMSSFNKLRNTAKKLLKSISYNDNNSSQGLLPPNLRLTLVPQSWPQGLNKEACQKIDAEEQIMWNNMLQKIFLARQNFLRNTHTDYKLHIDKYSVPESLHNIIVTDFPDLATHQEAIQFLVAHFTETSQTPYATNMDEEITTTSSSSSSSSSSATAAATTSHLVTDLTDTATTRELISIVTSLTADLKDLKKTFGAGKGGLKSLPTSIPAREKSSKQAKRVPQPSPAQHLYGPPPVQHPYGYPQFQQYLSGQAISYPAQPPPYTVQPSPYPVQPYPYPPMNGQYNSFPNYSPPPPQHPPRYLVPTHDTGNPTVTVNRGKSPNTKVRFLKN